MDSGRVAVQSSTMSDPKKLCDAHLDMCGFSGICRLFDKGKAFIGLHCDDGVGS
jgi:hypothetical protein